MPTRTAVAGDDFDPRKIFALLGVAGAGFTIYKFARGNKVAPLALVVAAFTLYRFFKD